MKERLKKIFGAVLFIICTLLGLTFLRTIFAFIAMPWCIIGLVICLSVILLLIYYRKLMKIRFLRLLIRIYTVVLAVGTVYIVMLSSFMVSAFMNTPQNAVSAGTFSIGTPQTVVVLGCQAINGYPSEMLKSRLDKAVDYMKENPYTVCIVTGGQGGNEIEPEAVTMKRYMITNGIDKSRIYTEENSTNTQENIAFMAEIIMNENLPQDIVIVSEGYHLYRARRQAEKHGFSPLTLPADSHDAMFALPSCWLRECIAITRDYAADILG